MSNKTHRRFDPWRTAPVQEMSRKVILQTQNIRDFALSLSRYIPGRGNG